MNKINRRQFIKRGLTATAGAYLGLSSLKARPAYSANNEIRIAIIGMGIRGRQHISFFQDIEGVNLVAMCDPDRQRLNRHLEEYKIKYGKPDSAIQGYKDFREILDRKDIDAVVIASPNHWHSLMTILACQAGKHVYVEKPVSHCIWEGRKMVEAARKYNRIVQAGTQHHSCPAVQEAARDIQAGKYGKVKWIHCSRLNTNNRGPIGKLTEPQPVPDYIDYNLWAGPAPMTPLMRQNFHYDWHWQWNWGDGETANWGIHYIDDLRHIMGFNDVPTKVVTAGNRFVWDDNGQTPNMHFSLFDYEGVKVVVEIRNLPDPMRPGGQAGAVYLNMRDGNYIMCEDGHIRIARGGGWYYDKDGNRSYQYKGDGGASHIRNFIDALRSGRSEDLNSEIEIGHLSTAMCHQANAAFRAGSEASVDEIRESFKGHEDAVNMFNDILEQLDGNEVDLAEQPFIFGPELTYDRRQEKFVGANADKANQYIKCSYRDPFVVPETV